MSYRKWLVRISSMLLRHVKEDHDVCGHDDC